MDNWVIVYDISDDRRRLKVAETLEDFGDRVQESVFEVEAGDADLDLLTQRLRDIISPDEDKIRLYPLCRNCRAKSFDLGTCQTTPFDSEEVIII